VIVSARCLHAILVASVVACARFAIAQDTYMEPEAFLEETFPDGVPEPDVVWLIGDIKTDVDQIMGHPLGELRVRYWHKDHRSAWILEEIGKEEPITTGIVVHQGKIEHIQVLIYRESRGWEVRHDFFTRQFEGAELRSDGELDRTIDNISGATLSVRALTKLARLALYLDKQVSR
jgi:hypothetical protein